MTTKHSITTISTADDAAIAAIIRQVGQEFGAIGEGFGPSDEEVAAMSHHYREQDRSRYFVARLDQTIIGGGGIAALNHSTEVCELKKLFILPRGRGLGLGKAIVEHCLDYARHTGYQRCYLDTLSNMTAAIALYQKMGFERLDAPLAGSIHNGCDIWMVKDL
ncbi:GNAT family N-acetyltransferase [Gynuella sunshinyii]|uniref:Putative acetyltransferase n=1 Tax=Gynuella sunshinyii YC6258 TaxID=1445510 RepID=A0A0C5W5R8_9GAMM|nr:GNAT family N-acetyltransferase [Gynuella sunshinyii]AJQ97949.1 putative acetyltransferase [Gynuella sunshinyii YC6258]